MCYKCEDLKLQIGPKHESWKRWMIPLLLGTLFYMAIVMGIVFYAMSFERRWDTFSQEHHCIKRGGPVAGFQAYLCDDGIVHHRREI